MNMVMNSLEALWDQLRLMFAFSQGDKQVLAMIAAVLTVLYVIGCFL